MPRRLDFIPALLLCVLFSGLRLCAQPDNDSFAHRIPLSGSDVRVTAYFLDATLEAGEPEAPRRFADSLWWTWTAPTDGFLDWAPLNYSLRQLAIYRGTQLESLTLVQQGPRIPYFPVTAGTAYQLTAGALVEWPADVGVWDLQLRFRTPVTNDTFAHRIRLSGDRILLSGHNAGATQTPGEPPGPGFAGAVWWEWTPTVSGLASLVWDHPISGGVFLNRGSDLEHLEPLFDEPGVGGWRVTAGEPVQLALASWDDSSRGDFAARFQVSPITIVEPLDGAAIADRSALPLRLAGLPENVTSITVLAPSLQSWTFEGRPSEVVLTNLPVARLDLQVLANTADDLVLHSPSIGITVRGGHDAFIASPEVLAGDDDVGGWFPESTLEAGEPQLPLPANNGTLWWRWSAPTNGWLVLDSRGRDSLARQVFRGDTLANLTEAVPLEGGNADAPLLRFPVGAGQTFRIRLWQPFGLPGWQATRLRFLPLAGNDAFDQAEILSGGQAEARTPHAAVSCDPGEPGVCPDNSGSRWYAWMAPGSGRLFLRLEPSWPLDPLTSLTLFTGANLGVLETVADSGIQLEAAVRRGETYRIRVRTVNEVESSAPDRLVLTYLETPANDDFANRQYLTGTSGDLTASNDEATREEGEDPSARSVWWSWTAPGHGVLEVEVVPDPENAVLTYPSTRFWTGAGAGALQLMPGQSEAGQSSGVFVMSGQTVAISVADRSTATPGVRTKFRLVYRYTPAPPNDAFADRTVLSGIRVSTRGTNWTAVPTDLADPRVNASRAQRSVWWEWTAPESGWLTAETEVARLVLFTGTNLADLKPLARLNPLTNLSGALHAPVIKGTNYFLLAGDTEATYPSLPYPGRTDGFELILKLTRFALDSLTNGIRLPADAPVGLRITPDPLGLNGNLSSVTYLLGVPSSGTPLALDIGTTSAAPDFPLEASLLPGYRLMLARATNAAGEILWSPPVVAQFVPRNDDFAHAEVLAGRVVTLTPYFMGGTRESGEPAPNRGTNGTLWYRWTAPRGGTVSISLREESPDVYTGTRLADLKRISPLNQPGRLAFLAEEGVEYFLRVTEAPVGPSGISGVSLGSLHLSLATTTLASPGAESRFAFGDPIPFRVETSEALEDLASVEYRVDGEVLVTVTSPPFVYLWTQASPGLHEVMSVPQLKSGEFLESSSRRFIITPGNDRFDNRITLDGTPKFLEGTTAGATPDDGNPGAAGEVWFSWKAPADGLLMIRPFQVSGIEVFTGNEFDTLERLPAQVDFSSPYRIWPVSGGREYHVAVQQAQAQESGFPFRLEFAFHPPAGNDHFADRLTLTGAEGETTASFIFTTHELGEPTLQGILDATNSVWWTWTPPADGVVRFGFPDLNAPDEMILPYLGNSLTALTPLPSLGNNTWVRPRWYPVTAGIPVQIALVNRGDALAGLRWDWHLHGTPENDTFAARIPVSGPSAIINGRTIAATREAGEPPTSQPDVGTVWWAWTPGVDGEGLIQVTDLAGQPTLSVFEGASLDSLVPRASSFGSPYITFEARAGVTYPIRVEAFLENISLTFRMRTAAANDDFARREEIQGSQAQVTGANWRATREFHEPQHAGEWGGRSVWYRWRAPDDGPVRVEIQSGPQLLLAVYEGSEVTELRPVAARPVGAPSPLTFDAVVGHEYALAVDGWYGATGDFQLVLEQTIPPAPVLSLVAESETQLRLIVSGLGTGIWILESSDLASAWTPLESLSSAEVSVELLIEPAAEPGSRFYRVRRNTAGP